MAWNSGLITQEVNGEAGMQMYPVAPNTRVLLIDFNGGKFWIKATDQFGNPQQVRTFSFKEILPPKPETEQDKQIRMLQGDVETMKDGLEEMRKMLEYLTGGNTNAKPD